MGSESDAEYCKKIASYCQDFGLKSVLRVSSAHKSTDDVLQIIAEYEGRNNPKSNLRI